MLTLVKDLEDFKIVFYWIDAQKEQVSPLLPTLIHAREWYWEYNFSLYKGEERRQRLCDRRNSEFVPLDLLSRRKVSSSGRRSTDKTIRVDIDLVTSKIHEMQDIV